MKRSLFIILGIFFIFPSVAQQAKETKGHSQWKNKSRLGISIVYDYHEFDHRYSLSSIYGFIPTIQEPNNPHYAQEVIPLSGEYKIKENELAVIRLQVDYWLFPFLNVYATGGRIYNYSKLDVRFSIKDIQSPSFTSTQDLNGWEYGGGIKGEFTFKRFKPQIGYSISWDDHNDIHDKTLTQTIEVKLGYMIPVNKTWIKNIDIYAGSAYNYMKLKYGFYIFYDEQTLSELLRAYDSQSSYQLTAILDQLTLKNIHDWNMITGIDIELSHHFHFKLDASFLGRKTSLSMAVSYRLFKKK